MKKQITESAAVLLILCLSGCAFQAGLPSYGTERRTENPGINRAKADTVDKAGAAEKEKPSLTDDFASQYIDTDSFDDMKQRTIDGIAITNDRADMTEAEIRLWSDMIASEDFPHYTTDDLNEREAELEGILNSLAEKGGLTMNEFAEKYNMSEDEAYAFADSQAEKYVTNNAKSSSEESRTATGNTTPVSEKTEAGTQENISPDIIPKESATSGT